MKIKCDCGYCTRETFVWQTAAGKIWIEVPKNASSSIKRRLQDDRSFTMFPRKKLNGASFREGFVVLRDPLSRFRCLLAHYFLPDGGRYDHGKKWLSLHAGVLDASTVTGENISGMVLNKFNYIKFIYQPHHWNSQASFIPDEFYKIKHRYFYNMQWAKKHFPSVENVSKSGEVLLTDTDIAKIKQIYADDFQLIENLKNKGEYNEIK